MQNYFIQNRETDKLELHFDKATYQALSYEQKKEVKSYFIWSRTANAWVSKARITGGLTTGYFPKQIAQKLGLADNGATGEAMSQLDRVTKRNDSLDRKKAYYSDVDDSIYIDWEQYIPSDRLSQDHNSISFFNHDYPAAFKGEMKDVISDIKTRLKVSSEQELPTYIKTSVERYAKSYADYLGRYVRNRTYAPSPMVVGPAKYPWHRLDKAHDRDGRNFKDLDEAKDRLKRAVQKAGPGAFDQRADPYYLQNRIKDAQASLNRAKKGIASGKYLDHYEKLQKESAEMLAYWQDQVEDQGGLQYSKQKLIEAGATHIKYGGKNYPVVRFSDKTVTIGKWFNDNPKITFQIPYAKISGSSTNWDDAILPKPGEKVKKLESEKPVLKVGDQAIYDSGYARTMIVKVRSVGRKYYNIGGYGNVEFSKLEPIALNAQNRLDELIREAQPMKQEILDSMASDDMKRYDLKHFLHYKTKVYRENMELLSLDLQAAGYPKTGALLVFFKERLGEGAKPAKTTNKAKNAKRRSASTTKKKATAARKSTAKTKKAQAIERIAARRGVEPSTVKVVLNEDTNSYVEKRPKASVKVDQIKRRAIKSGDVATDKPKLTKAQKAAIKQGAIDDAKQATSAKKTLTAEQVIKIGKQINFNRFHIVIEGKVYNVREDFDSPVTNSRRLAPTEENLLKWAEKPGRYDLIGVDAAGKVDVTVFKKRDKNAVPKRIRLAAKSKALTKKAGKNRKPGRRKKAAKSAK